LANIFSQNWLINDSLSFCLTLMFASTLPGESWPSKTRVKMKKKTSINFVYPDLWLSKSQLITRLTVVQQRVYLQMTFRNVYEFKKELVKCELVWSRTLSTLLSMKGESIFVPVFAQWANISINFIISSWKKQYDEVSVKMSKMWTKRILCII